MSARQEGIGTRLAVVAGLLQLVLSAGALMGERQTGSAGLLAQGVHSLVAASGIGLALVGGVRSSERGEALFWVLIAPLLLIAFGAGVALQDGAAKWLASSTVRELDSAVPLMVGGVLLSGGMAVAAWQQGEDLRARVAAILSAAGAAGLAVAGVGFQLAAGGRPEADGAGALGVALVMATEASLLALLLRRAMIEGSRGEAKRVEEVEGAGDDAGDQQPSDQQPREQHPREQVAASRSGEPVPSAFPAVQGRVQPKPKKGKGRSRRR